jgi:hypothetical protein
MSAHDFAIPLIQQSFIEFGVTLIGSATVATGALYYFRHVRQERPPVGRFNGRDIVLLMALIVALPFLYQVMPGWLITCFLAITFAASLSIGYQQVVGPLPLWLGIGVLLGANIWESHTMMGSVAGWQLWWVELDILVALGAIAICNLYIQGGMKLIHVVCFGLALACYDVGSTLGINVTAVLVEKFIGQPLDPTFGMRFNVNNYGIGIGDLLFYALFVVACYKAYGWVAARLAMIVMVIFGAAAPSLIPLLIQIVDFRNDILIPSQIFFAPAGFVLYLYLRHKYGAERTMAQYRASTGQAASPGPLLQPEREPAPEPASA